MVVGVGSGEVSAVTRLRMTSMAGIRMRAAWPGSLFGLCIYLRVPRETTAAGGRGEERDPGRALITQDAPLKTKST